LIGVRNPVDVPSLIDAHALISPNTKHFFDFGLSPKNVSSRSCSCPSTR
jgi:hypothetical protein